MKWYLYIVKCKDRSFYTGITKNIERRVAQHNSGTGAKSIVKSKRPVKLVYKEKYINQSLATKRETEIKGWSRLKKLRLINRVNPEREGGQSYKRRVHPEERSDEGPVAQR